jgi:hypothetical protein
MQGTPKKIEPVEIRTTTKVETTVIVSSKWIFLAKTGGSK